jgi:hypothetical protein
VLSCKSTGSAETPHQPGADQRANIAHQNILPVWGLGIHLVENTQVGDKALTRVTIRIDITVSIYIDLDSSNSITAFASTDTLGGRHSAVSG